MKLSVWSERSQRTGTYSLRWRDPDTGLKQRILCRDKEEMRKEKLRIEVFLSGWRKGGDTPEAVPLVLLEEYLQAIGDLGRRTSTLEMKRRNLTPYLETLFKLSALTHEGIKIWIKSMHVRYKVDTIAIRMRDLRAFINWLIKEGKLKESPFKGLSVPVSSFVGRRLNLEEIKTIYSHLDGEFKAFFVVAVDTGARHGEILGAEWSELDLVGRSWLIPAHKCKTRINRTVPLSAHAVEAFKSLPKGLSRPFGMWTRFMTQKAWKRALKAAKIDGRVRIHDIRHSWASNWKGPRAELKSMAGWTTDVMASKYTHTEMPYLSEMAQRTSNSVWGEFGANMPKSQTKPVRKQIDKT